MITGAIGSILSSLPYNKADMIQGSFSSEGILNRNEKWSVYGLTFVQQAFAVVMVYWCYTNEELRGGGWKQGAEILLVGFIIGISMLTLHMAVVPEIRMRR